jgi:hemoglobin-like flavoprotein
MTPEQTKLVQQSFARLAPAADAVAEMFYRELFALDPGLRKLFKSDLAQQGRKLMSLLGTAIGNLDRLESIAPVARDLGRRHAAYGVASADYETVARALIGTLEQGLGSDFTPALREAWASCYRVLACEMQAGASEDRGEVIVLESACQPAVHSINTPMRVKLMSPSFVKYTPDIEAVDPGFEENLQLVIGRTEQYIAQSVTTEGTGRAVRDAHAKGYGLIRGEVEILDQVPAEYAQGIYATPGKHDALIRFSNGSPHAGADARLGGATGLALKIFGIAGPTLLEDEPDSGTFDYANINAPVFFCNTVEHYLFVQQLFVEAPTYFAQGTAGFHRFYTDFLTGKGTLDQDHWAWDELLAFLRVLQSRPVNLLLSTYWTMGAVRHGGYIAKVRFAPVPAFADKVVERDLDLASAAEVYRPALIAELRERPYEFDIQIQLCADLTRMPVEDVTVEWPEQLSPFVTVAKLHLPQQDISDDANLEKMDGLSFTPWRVTAEHAPLGNIMRVRKEVYRHSSILRHRLNQQPRVEPSTADQVLAVQLQAPPTWR